MTAITTNASSVREVFNFKYLSMIHTRLALRKLTLAVDDSLPDNEREAMLSVVTDTCGGSALHALRGV